MIKKHIKLVIIVILLLFIAVTFWGLKRYNQEKLTTLMQIEEHADVILSGVLIKRDEAADRTEDNDEAIINYTGSVEVQKVYKNSSALMLNESDTITVRETEVLLPIPEQERAYYVSGYLKMKEGEDYLLFLKYVEEQEAYIPVEYGKIPINKAEVINALEYEDDISKKDEQELNIQKEIAADARQKYL